jgi:DNA primase
MININDSARVRALRIHAALPDEIRSFLKSRGILPTIIQKNLIGWDGERITLPVFGREREILGFRYAKTLTDISPSAEVTSDAEVREELYGWDSLAQKPCRVVVCDSEFDRLVLEGRGITAVSVPAGTETFRADWLPYFEPLKYVYAAFSRSAAGEAAGKALRSVMPRVRIVALPPESYDVTEFLVWQNHTNLHFEVLLANATSSEDDPADTPPSVQLSQPLRKSDRARVERLRKAVKLHEVVDQFATLRACGKRLVTHCPFHNYIEPSFSVYPATNTYACTVCGASGDAVQFLMDKESMTLEEALKALERFEITNELYGTG